jgi:hypothetical protein
MPHEQQNYFLSPPKCRRIKFLNELNPRLNHAFPMIIETQITFILEDSPGGKE